MNDESYRLRQRHEPVQNKGAVSRQPIRRIVWRRRFDADAHGEIHLALAEHEPMPGHDRPRLFLHLHAINEGHRKPAALNVPQLAGFIRRLQDVLNEMSPNGPREAREPSRDAAAEPPRRVRGRRTKRHAPSSESSSSPNTEASASYK